MTKIGFIGQGFIGKSMADDFAERGYEVVRYALETEYIKNREKISKCDVVFIAVPTPTTTEGFDCSAVKAVLPLVGSGKVAVVKSTILPGTTKSLQEQFSNIYVLHSPEFLREKHAVSDARKPERTVIGIPKKNQRYTEIANYVLSILPPSPYQLVCKAEEAEIIKYTGNVFLAIKVIYMNLIYDLAEATGADYDVISEAVSADHRIGPSHTKVIDGIVVDNNKPGRGAGGHCFPKDLSALREFYLKTLPNDVEGIRLLEAVESKNKELLVSTKKDVDLLKSIYKDL